MGKHRNPRARVSKRPTPDNFDTSILINQLYEDLVEVEALAVTADEAVTELPPRPRGKYGRTLARLYTLLGKTSGRTQGALERGRGAGRHARGPAGGTGPQALAGAAGALTCYGPNAAPERWARRGVAVFGVRAPRLPPGRTNEPG